MVMGGVHRAAVLRSLKRFGMVFVSGWLVIGGLVAAQPAVETASPPPAAEPAVPPTAIPEPPKDEVEAPHEPEPTGLSRSDPATGRDLANYPPDNTFQHQHIRIQVDLGDLLTRELTGEVTLTSAAVGEPQIRMLLDAKASITIEAVTVNGAPAMWDHKDGQLEITLPRPARPRPAPAIKTVITYRAKGTSTKEGSGLIWARSDPKKPEAGAMIHSQGQADLNSMWFPCHDFPNQRLTSEVIATVPEGYTVVSNGRLVRLSRDNGRATWHWKQEQPHPSYLIALAVGRWDVVQLNPSSGPALGPPSNPRLSMPVYGPLGSAAILRNNFARTPAMMTWLEGLFGEPYPWAKYAQLMARQFAAGGMENTSLSILDWDTAQPGDHDDLIVHELAHQWLGDLLTCKSWEHLWLNEGWATYIEWEWARQRGGDAAYAKSVSSAVTFLKMGYKSRPAKAPATLPMASNRYLHADDTFTKRDNPYSKGGFVLHMLNQRLGDEVFWRGVRLYIQRFKFKQVETDDFRQCLEEVSGQSLERFFAQWVTMPGLPTLNITSTWNDEQRALAITIEQLQPIDADNPAFAFRLPILCEVGGVKSFVYISSEQRSVTRSFPLDSKPTRLVIDPSMSVLAAIETAGDVPAISWWADAEDVRRLAIMNAPVAKTALESMLEGALP